MKTYLYNTLEASKYKSTKTHCAGSFKSAGVHKNDSMDFLTSNISVLLKALSVSLELGLTWGSFLP